MNGLNDRFKRGPEKFLREMVLQESAELLKANPSEGLYDFDFEPSTLQRLPFLERRVPGLTREKSSSGRIGSPGNPEAPSNWNSVPTPSTFSRLTWEVANYG
jgi:hypothetical protein